jgi:hypothetical protein
VIKHDEAEPRVLPTSAEHRLTLQWDLPWGEDARGREGGRGAEGRGERKGEKNKGKEGQIGGRSGRGDKRGKVKDGEERERSE